MEVSSDPRLPPTVQRLVKRVGFGNVAMEQIPMPQPGAQQVLVRVVRSLISRGSELLTRYMREEAVSPEVMGYSAAGEVVALGPGVSELTVGDRVLVNGPHAQYLVANVSGRRIRAFRIPDQLEFERAAFLSLSTSALMWSRTTPVQPGDTVVVLGQGLVGGLYAQTVRGRLPAKVVVVDATDLRCRIARSLGADLVIDASLDDPVQLVRGETDGHGAQVVVECVGGVPGLKAFEQAQQMLGPGGVIHLIGKYQGGPLPLHGDSFMDKMLVAGIRVAGSREEHMEDAAQMLSDGRIQVTPMVTQRMPGDQTPEAYHLLHNHPEEALAVILTWD